MSWFTRDSPCSSSKLLNASFSFFICLVTFFFSFSFFICFLIRSRENISRFHFGIVCLVSLGPLKKGCTLGLYSSTPPCESYCCNPYMGKVLSPSAPSLLLQLAPKIKRKSQDSFSLACFYWKKVFYKKRNTIFHFKCLIA